jgi:hypothetical protein
MESIVPTPVIIASGARTFLPLGVREINCLIIELIVLTTLAVAD